MTGEKVGNGSDEKTVKTHQVGDQFTVGEGEEVVDYKVTGVRAANALGSKFAEEIPNHIFLIVALKIRNQTDEPVQISRDAYTIRDSEGRTYESDSWADIFLEQDDRVDLDPILFNELRGNRSTEGALIFDVHPRNPLGLLIRSSTVVATDESHFVELGTIKT